MAPPHSDQDTILAFLGHAEPGITRVDTHASIVFLGKDRVLKVKRAIRLPYLDYSGLEQRKAACQAELDVNRSFAPALYRRVVPITQDDGGLAIGGRGKPVEWALEMARFDEKAGLDRLASETVISRELADLMSDAIRRTHDGATAAKGEAWLLSIGEFIDRNTDKFRSIGSLPRSTVDRLHNDSHAVRIAQTPKLACRVEAGFVRRCHGDLHLGNMVLIDGKPVLFDAIEFDPVIATTDVLYDLAFVLMDMLHYGQRGGANVMMNRYLSQSDPANLDALSLLPLFLSLRAAIRANVLFTKWEQTGRDPRIAEEAKRYFELSTHLIRPRQAVAVAIGGLSGTGKTVLARAIAPSLGAAPGAVVLRSDVFRKAIFGVDELTPLPPSAYSPDVTARVYRHVFETARRIVLQGHAVVIDAAFLRGEERDAFDAMEPRSSVRFGLFLQADISVRLSRIAGRRHDASDATAAVALVQETSDLGEVTWPVIGAGGTPEDTFANAVLHLAPTLAKENERA